MRNKLHIRVKSTYSQTYFFSFKKTYLGFRFNMDYIKRRIQNHPIDPAFISRILEKSFDVLPHERTVMGMDKINDRLAKDLGDGLPVQLRKTINVNGFDLEGFSV